MRIKNNPIPVPGAAPEFVQCDPLSPDSVSVSWKPPPLELSNGVILGYHVTFRLENKIGGENRLRTLFSNLLDVLGIQYCMGLSLSR